MHPAPGKEVGKEVTAEVETDYAETKSEMLEQNRTEHVDLKTRTQSTFTASLKMLKIRSPSLIPRVLP